MNGSTLLLQPVSYKRYFRCYNCVLLLVYAINLSLSTDLVDPYGENTFSKKPPLALYNTRVILFMGGGVFSIIATAGKDLFYN